MIPRPFELHSPTTVSEAVSLLRSKPGAEVLAGGQSLVPLMKLRVLSPTDLVDMRRVRGLSYVKRAKGRVLVGAMTTHSEVAASSLLASTCQPLPEAAGLIGDRQVRNRGTIGGTICQANPAADVPAALLALDAEFRVAGPSGGRVIKAGDFFKGPHATSLKRAEILVEVRIPVAKGKTGAAFIKLTRGASDLATVGAAAIVSLDRRGNCERVRLALAGAGPTPMRATRAERLLVGEAPADALVAEAGKMAAEDARPSTDIRGSAEYKQSMLEVYTRRALKLSLARARGEAG